MTELWPSLAVTEPWSLGPGAVTIVVTVSSRWAHRENTVTNIFSHGLPPQWDYQSLIKFDLFIEMATFGRVSVSDPDPWLDYFFLSSFLCCILSLFFLLFIHSLHLYLYIYFSFYALNILRNLFTWWATWLLNLCCLALNLLPSHTPSQTLNESIIQEIG